jgi:hypothetical protein
MREKESPQRWKKNVENKMSVSGADKKYSTSGTGATNPWILKQVWGFDPQYCINK